MVLAGLKNLLLVKNVYLEDVWNYLEIIYGKWVAMYVFVVFVLFYQINFLHFLFFCFLKVSFTVARFNRDFEGNERAIVTSSGPYVITWDFTQIKRGILNKYQIKQYSDNVVDEQFKFGEDKAIVVTLPDDVKIAKRVKQ